MLTFGGVDATGNYLVNNTYRLDRSSVKVTISQPSIKLAPRAGHSAVVIPQGTLGCTATGGSCVLVFGGRSSDTYFNEMQRIDPGE